jgi:hypothetical protein
VVSREGNVLDLAVLLDNGAEDHLVDAVGDVAFAKKRGALGGGLFLWDRIRVRLAYLMKTLVDMFAVGDLW